MPDFLFEEESLNLLDDFFPYSDLLPDELLGSDNIIPIDCEDFSNEC